MASQGRSHEVQDLRKDGQGNTNHDGRLHFHRTRQKSSVLKKRTPSRRERPFCEKRVPGWRQSRRVAKNYKQLQKHTCLIICAPSRPEAHLGDGRAPITTVRRKAACTQKTQKSGVLKKCTPSMHEAHFCPERVPGRHESRGVVENYKQL